MKTRIALFLLPSFALAADPAPESESGPADARAFDLEPAAAAPAWRVSVGFRAAPGIRTSADVDARAAVRAAGGGLRPAGRAGTSSGGSGASTSVSVSSGTSSSEDLGSSTTGTTEADALAGAGYDPGRTRYEFDGGFVDLDDGAGIAGETQNWHFDDASAFSDGSVSARNGYSSTTVSRTRTTETETVSTRETSTRISVSRSTSFREEWGAGLGVSSDETACGVELRLDRTLWENEAFGLDAGFGYVWFDDVDCFSVRGRAYSAASSSRTEIRRTDETRVTTTTRTRTTETETSRTDSGAVVTSIAQPEFTDLSDILNDDGSIGGGYVVGGTLEPGRQIPVLTVTEDRFSTAVERNPAETAGSSRTLTSERSAVSSRTSATTVSSSSKTATRTVDVRSEGTISLQELRLGVRPFWKATRRLALRGDLGLLAIRSELETNTRIAADGTAAAELRKDEEDWTFRGCAGLALDLEATDSLSFSFGAETRFPHRRVHFDDGVVSGSVELARWSAFASVGWRF